MTKGAIVYYSRSGNNHLLAREIQKRLKCDLFAIKEAKRRSMLRVIFDLLIKRDVPILPFGHEIGGYDYVVFISPIWEKRLARPLASFLKTQKEIIPPYYFLTICNSVIGQKEKLMDELRSLIGHPPIRMKQLWVNELLPPNEQNSIKHTFSFRMKDVDLSMFDLEIDHFVRDIRRDVEGEVAFD